MGLLFSAALLVRIGTALALDRRNASGGAGHEFADTQLYSKLALVIATGQPYSDGKRFVGRTPGYPLFLAGCYRLFGNSSVGARHAQAAVGAVSCVLLFLLVRQLVDRRAAWIAAGAAVVYPFAVFLSVVLLSEALFTALLLVQLLLFCWLLRSLTEGDSLSRLVVWSAVAGVIGAAATLVRPSWISATPFVSLLFLVCSPRQFRSDPSSIRNPSRRAGTIRNRSLLAAASLFLAFLLGMSPWWVRNWRVTGHFVPTTLWVGASLYDGLNPQASGASDMRFMDRPEEFGLDPRLHEMNEWEQDQYLRRAALDYARAQPGRVFWLAAVKLVRFWNPLPNAAEWQSWPLRIVSLVTCGPVLLLAVVGAWRLRRRVVVIVFLAGPVFYFCAVHLVFVSSIRYREAAMLPVLGLAAVGWSALRSDVTDLSGVVRPN
ncbi:MAG: glycosyltransferase family 39 protein [Planctomycetes bacterium]|nr:glycosyltransferase family 39 protein [Planctomycetota bacterium]